MLPAGISSEGSPPRGRGKVCIAFLGLSASRITPAWAGKRYQQQVGRAVGRDHPRVGGEKAATFRAVCGPRGSPPRGRGKVGPVMLIKAVRGITPAWAGKSRLRGPSGRRSEDHPRVGGEKSISAPSWGPGTGSPPRRRGKDISPCSLLAASRITPAWAGKSHDYLNCVYQRRDHPRVGGEKRSIRPQSPRRTGSPPRGRGKEVTNRFHDW